MSGLEGQGFPSECSAQSDGSVSCDFTSGNAVHYLTVPAGAHDMTYLVAGAAGGGGSRQDNVSHSAGGAGGGGAKLTGDPGNLAGKTLTIGVGSAGNGRHGGGTNPVETFGRLNGGSGGDGTSYGGVGGHGGAGSLLMAGSQLLVVAGGGGGGVGGHNYDDGRGGGAGGTGAEASGPTGTNGGDGGGVSGSGGGGGGGGYVNGGKGGSSGYNEMGNGGQGGGNWAGAVGTVAVANGAKGGDGEVKITWQRGAPAFSASATVGARAYESGDVRAYWSLPSGAGGTVTVRDQSVGNQTVCSAAASAGSCVVPEEQRSGGSHSLRLSYDGDAGYTTATADTTLTLVKNPVTATSSYSTNSDGTLTVNGTFAPADTDGVVDGTASISAVGETDLTRDCVSSTPNKASEASWTSRRGISLQVSCTVDAVPGDHTFRIKLTGSTNTADGSVDQQVTAAKYTPGVVNLSLARTALDHYGAMTTATVTVPAAGNGKADPDGTMYIAPTSGGTGQGASCFLASRSSVTNHVATYSCLLMPKAGQHEYVASYNGNAYYSARSSDGVEVVTAQATPTLTIATKASDGTATNTIKVGDNLVVSATAKTADGTAIATGSLRFYDGPPAPDDSNKVGTVDLSTATPGTGSVTVKPAAGNHKYYVKFVDADGNYVPTTTDAPNVGVEPIPSTFGVVVTADASKATSAGVPVTVTTTLSMSTVDREQQPVTVSPAAATACTRADTSAGDTRTITSVCKYVLQPGTSPTFTAGYSDDLVGKLSKSKTFTVPASPVSVGVDVDDVTYGDHPEFTTTVTPVVTGAAVSGAVTVREGETTLCTATVATIDGGATATCTAATLPHAGSHDVVARFVPDAAGTATAAAGATMATAFSVAKAPASIALSTSTEVDGTDQYLVASAAATADDRADLTPTGSVTFGDVLASCKTVKLVDGLATCKVAMPAAGTKSTVSATLVPGADFRTGSDASVSSDYQRPVSGPCSVGFGKLWNAVKKAKGGFSVDAGGLGSVSVTATGNLGDCDSAASLGAKATVSLFGGTLSASNVTAVADNTTLCITGGSLSLPAIWKSGALVVKQAICFPLTEAGGIGKPTSGQLNLTNTGTSGAPLISLPGVSGAATLAARLGTACAGKTVGEGSCADPVSAVTVTGTVARVSDTQPGVTVVATVRPGGDLTASVMSPISILGSDLTLEGTVTRQGTGALSAEVSATTSEAKSAAAGLIVDPKAKVTLTGATGDTPKLKIEAVVRVGTGSAQLPVQLSGSLSSLSSFSLDLKTADPVPSWTPIAGLTMRPKLSGSFTRSGTTSSFAMLAEGADGDPLATWNAGGGTTFTVDKVSIGGDPTAVDLRCPYTSGGSVLALSGKVAIADMSVEASGCLSLGDKGWHLAAKKTTTTLGRLSLTDLVLNVSKPADGALALSGSATAALSVGGFSGSTTVTMRSENGVFVVGGQIDATSLGLPSKYTYLAYASGAVEGWQTGLGEKGLGEDGEVDLPAGISLFGAMTLPTGVASALRQAKFALPATATVTFAAVVPKSGGSLSFTAELADPSGMPLLTLPSGSVVDSATITYADSTFTLVAAGRVKGQDGSMAKAKLSVAISGNGSLTGTAGVENLSLLGRTVDLTGSISRTAAGKLAVSLQGKLTGSMTLGDATVKNVTVSLGTSGLAAGGTIEVASTSLDFTASFASTTSYSLDVSATVRNWTPARSVTVNATLFGSLTRTSQGYTYDFIARPADGGDALVEFTPGTGVTLSLASFELSNRRTAPADCDLDTAGDTWLAATGSLSIDVGAAQGTGSGTGCFDLTRPSFSFTVSVPGADFGGESGKVSLSGLSVSVTRSATGAFTAAAQARVRVQMPSGGQFSAVATLTFGPDGFAIGAVADLSSYLGDSASRAYLFFSNATMTVDTGDDTVGKLKLTPGVTVGLGFTVSDDVAKALKQVGLGVGAGTKLAATVHLDLDNATIKLKVAVGFKQTNLFSLSNGTYLRLDDTSLIMTLSPTQPSFGFETAATLHVPASMPGGSASDVSLKGGIRIGTELSAYLSVSKWNDALGISGLNLRTFTLQGGITLTGLPLPSLAVAATVDGLPSSLANVIGYRQGAPISIALAIGQTNLLFDVKIGTKGSTTPALQPFAFAGKADLLSVNFAELYISPTGATIGDEVYPAGFSLAFDGRIAGVDVSVLAKVDPVKASLYFRGSIGTITAGSLVVGPTVLTIDVSPSKFDVTFSGRIAIGPASVQIGPALRFSGYLKADVTLAVGTSGIAAKLNFEASVSAGAYVAHDWCKQDGIWVLCNYYWDDSSPLTISATNLGFALNSDGLTVDIPNTTHSITFPWPKSASSARARSLTTGARMQQTIDDRLIAARGSTASRAPATAAPAAWQRTGSLGGGRVLAASATLRDGSVLVAGGTQSGKALRSAEVYDSRTGGWHAAAAMTTPRSDPAEVRLADGRVLVVGGDTTSGETATAELYDPATDRWSSAGNAPYRSQAASAALLSDGTVLIAGGHVGGRPTSAAARFDPRTGRWQPLPALPGARAAAATANLPGGDVLIAGGMGADGPLRTAVVFDSDRDSWRTTASMQRARFYATTSTLPDGRVLVTGAAPEAETYDPHTARWTLAGIMNAPTQLASASTLANGDVVVAGGMSARGALTQVDRYDVTASRWYAQRALPQARAGAVAAALPGGRILIAGGIAQHQTRSDAFVYSANGSAVPAERFDSSALFAPEPGWPAWAWVLLVVGVLGLLAGVFVLLRRPRSRHRAG